MINWLAIQAKCLCLPKSRHQPLNIKMYSDEKIKRHHK